MRLIFTLFVGALASAPLVTAVGCGDNTGSAVDNTPFPTYEDCFTDHHVTESFPVQQAIEICCIDHPIGGAAMNTVCGATAASCEAYVTANLMASDATAAEITAACADYVVKRAG
jgi:hypothetical protein